MSRAIAVHVQPISLTQYIEDYVHWDSPSSIRNETVDSVNSLWSKFKGSITDPYDRSLIEVMGYLSTAYDEGHSESRIIETIIDEVEEIFEEAYDDFEDAEVGFIDTEIPFYFYLFCTALYDYLYEEEGIHEFDDYNIQMCTIYKTRIDLTFY